MALDKVIHIVRKADYAEQHVVDIHEEALQSLGPTSVRVRPVLVGLSANNIAYCYLGKFLKWWDQFPVTSAAPHPFNNREEYGLVPTWGYGEVIESNTPIQVGSLLWGLWPVATHPVDLQLEAITPEDHWTETSEQRRCLQKLDIEYVNFPNMTVAALDGPNGKDLALTAAIKPLWETSYNVNRFVFSSLGEHPIHPMPRIAQPWTLEDADLSSAVLIIYAASSKTGRSLIHELQNLRNVGTGPQGLLAVTAAESIDALSEAPFVTKVINYSAVAATETMDWIEKLAPQRIVTIDYGGRDLAASQLEFAWSTRCPGIAITKLGVGTEARVEDLDIQTFVQAIMSSGKVMCDASGQRDAAIARLGRPRYISEMNEAWERALMHGTLTNSRLDIHYGVKGETGFEGAWKKLCQGAFDPHMSTIIRL